MDGAYSDIVALHTNSPVPEDRIEGTDAPESPREADSTMSDEWLTQLGRDSKVENTSLENAGLLGRSQTSTTQRRSGGGGKKTTSGTSSAKGRTLNPAQVNEAATVSLSAEELAQLAAYEAELAERLKRTKS